MDRNDIRLLQAPGDLSLKNGDLALSRRGDLLLVNEDYHAFFRLVQEWRYNLPTLTVLFDAALSTGPTKASLEASLDKVFLPYSPKNPTPGEADHARFHEINDQLGASEVAEGLYAGTIILLINKLLGAFKSDIEAQDVEWKNAGVLRAECSFGQIVRAASNNFRHNDEWELITTPTAQQAESIRVLALALGESMPDGVGFRKFARDISPEIIRLLSGGEVILLEREMFSFAQAMLEARQKRLQKT